MQKRLRLHAPRHVGSQYRRQHLPAGLDRALGPAVLLRLECAHLHRQLGRRHHVRQKDEPPAGKLSPVAQIQILGQRIVLPAAGRFDRGPPPDAGRAVEVEEASAAVPAPMLQHEVPVEEERLQPGKQRVAAVGVPPTRLDHADSRVREGTDGALEELGRRHEVGVEDCDQLARGEAQPLGERSRLVASADLATAITDRESVGPQTLYRQARHSARPVRRVVQHLHFEPVPGVAQTRYGLDCPLDDVRLVEDGKLHREARRTRLRAVARCWAATGTPTVRVKIQEVTPVSTVDAEADQHREVQPHHEDIRRRHWRRRYNPGGAKSTRPPARPRHPRT